MFALPKMGRLVTLESFKDYVGVDYLVDAHPEPVKIRLDEVKVGIGASWMERQPFTLSFSTPFDTFLGEGNYRVRTPAGELVEFYLIPTQTFHEPRRHYHAVFS